MTASLQSTVSPTQPTSVPRIRTRRWRQVAFFLLGVLSAILRAATLPWRRASRATPRVILLEPFGMGDVLSLQPLVGVLTAAGAQVVVAAQPRWRECLPPSEAVQWLDPRLPWHGEGTSSRTTWPRLFRRTTGEGFRELRRLARGGIGLDPRGDVRSVILLTLAGCRRILTFDRYYVAADCRLPPGAATRIPAPRDVPRWKANLALLPATRIPGASPAEATPPNVNHLMQAGIREQPDSLALIPISPWTGKRWPAHHWHALLTRVSARGWRPFGLHGPGEQEQARQLLGSDLPLTECTRPAAWVRALQPVGAVLSVNTGPMHLADAMGKRLIVLNGSSQLPLWAPSNPNAHVLHHTDQFPCAPCHEVGEIPPCAAACMAAITPEEVCLALGSATPSP